MSKIKYIHCFGTSHTEGGGYELHLDNPINEKLKEFYKETNEEFTQFNFSYPGQLQKILKQKGSEIKVINHGKSGYGNERMYRLTFDIISEIDNIDEHIFIYEFSDFGRKEVFCKEINDYISINYEFTEDNINEVGGAQSYFEDTKETLQKIQPTINSTKEFLKKTFNNLEIGKLITRNNIFFCNFLLYNNINFFFTNSPSFDFKIPNIKMYEDGIERKIWYTSPFNGKKYHKLVDYIMENQLIIRKETNNISADGHGSLYGNKLIALHIFNKLVDAELLSFEKINPLDKKYKIFKNELF